MIKIKNKKMWRTLFCILCLTMIFFVIDYNCVKKQKQPIFCKISISPYNDGGSTIYYGLGYKVICFNKFGQYGEINGVTLGTVRYYYICSWVTTFEEAWEEIKDEAIQKNFEEFKIKQK